MLLEAIEKAKKDGWKLVSLPKIKDLPEGMCPMLVFEKLRDNGIDVVEIGFQDYEYCMQSYRRPVFGSSFEMPLTLGSEDETNFTELKDKIFEFIINFVEFAF